MRMRGFTSLWNIFVLSLAGLTAVSNASAHVVPEDPRGVLDLAAYLAELDRCAESIQHGDLSQLRESLPGDWIIQTEQSRIVVSTAWLTAGLRQAERDPGKSKAVLHELQQRLAAMRKSAQDLGAGANQANAASARPHLDKILRRHEFAGAEGPSQSELLQTRLQRWIEAQLLRLFSLLHVGRTAGNVVTWTVIGLSFAVLCYWIWQNASRALRNVPPTPPRAEATNDYRQWAKDASAAADRGDYREAVHCAYWATIVHLEALGVLKRDHARTPRESLRLLDPHPKERQLLGDFTRHFELIWYGYRPALPEDWSNARAHLEKMGCLTPSTPATANS